MWLGKRPIPFANTEPLSTLITVFPVVYDSPYWLLVDTLGRIFSWVKYLPILVTIRSLGRVFQVINSNDRKWQLVNFQIIFAHFRMIIKCRDALQVVRMINYLSLGFKNITGCKINLPCGVHYWPFSDGGTEVIYLFSRWLYDPSRQESCLVPCCIVRFV